MTSGRAAGSGEGLIPAATVVILRPGPSGLEALLTQRPSTMAFGPDLHVFPGGRVDPADRLAGEGPDPSAAATALGLGVAPDPSLTAEGAAALYRAAARETREEVGIQVDPRDLVPLTRWVTPRSMPRRFDARFFATIVAPGTVARPAPGEVSAITWQTPEAAIRLARDGRLRLWQPTFVTLQQLQDVSDERELRRAFRPGDVTGGPELTTIRPGLVRVDAPWPGGIPGRRARGWLLGTRELVVVDPGDPTGATSDALEAAAAGAGGQLAGVVVTSLDPARHAGVELLAHGLGLPVAGSAVVVGAPYPARTLDAADPIPFGDTGLTLGAVSALANASP